MSVNSTSVNIDLTGLTGSLPSNILYVKAWNTTSSSYPKLIITSDVRYGYVQNAYNATWTGTKAIIYGNQSNQTVIISFLPYEGTVSDSWTGSAILSRLAVASRSLSAPSTYSSVITRIYAGQRSPTGSSDFTSVLTRVFSGDRLLTLSATVTESITRLFSGMRAISSAPSFTEAVTRTYTGSRTPTEPFSISEAVARLFSGTRLPQDAQGYLSAVTRSYSGTRLVSGSSTFADIVTRVQSAIRSLSEAPAFTESLVRVFAGSRNPTGTWTSSENLLRTFSGVRLTQDSNDYSDSLQRTYGVSRGLSEASSFTELVTRIGSLTRNLSSLFNITSLMQRLASYTRTLSSATQYVAALVAVYTAGTPVTPPSGGGGGMIIKPQPSTVMVGAFFPEPRYFLLPSAKMYADITVTNPTDQVRIVKVHYTATLVDTQKAVYTGDLTLTISGGSHTYTIPIFVSQSGRYVIDITATDGGTATARQEIQVTMWQVWQGPVLLWSIIAFAAAILILFYRRIGEEW